MLKKIRLYFIVLVMIFIVSIVINSVAYAALYDINMNNSYSNIFSGGRKVEYHTGNLIPTDDVSGRAGKSVEAYVGRKTHLKVEIKGVSGGIGRRERYHSKKNAETWVYTQWTDDPNNDDTAEYARYWFNGSLIELR